MTPDRTYNDTRVSVVWNGGASVSFGGEHIVKDWWFLCLCFDNELIDDLMRRRRGILSGFIYCHPMITEVSGEWWHHNSLFHELPIVTLS